MPSDDLYNAARVWWDREGLRCPAKPSLLRQLSERGIGSARASVNGRQVRVRTGLRLVGDIAWAVGRRP